MVGLLHARNTVYHSANLQLSFTISSETNGYKFLINEVDKTVFMGFLSSLVAKIAKMTKKIKELDDTHKKKAKKGQYCWVSTSISERRFRNGF